MKKNVFILGFIALTAMTSCSKEKDCKCYLPENQVIYEKAEECKYLNINEIINDTTTLVLKFCVEE